MQRSPEFWALWANPIFHRYRRAKMRAGRLITWSICVVILATFIFLLPFTLFYYHLDQGNAVAAARTTLIPMLIFQGLILMLKGTFSVASGITRESSEGIMDYQRLTPMSPMAKIVGYLFGLPIREYFLFFLIFPFTIFAAIVGKVPLQSVAQVYAVFFSATLLYHITGFLAGTVVKRKMLAGVLSQLLILVIYWILPNMSFFGYAVFDYLTLYPAVYEQIAILYPEAAREVPKLSDNGAYFYSWKFNPAPFSIAVQLSLVSLFTVIIHRNWRNPGHHLLGKHFSVATYVALALVLLGTTMPLIKSGMIFLSQAWMEVQVGQRFGETVQSEEGLVAAGIFGLIASLVGLIIITIITPSVESYRKGIHRAKKLQQRFQPLGADSAMGIWHTLAIVLIGGVVWCWFSHTMMQSGWIRDTKPLGKYAVSLLLALALPLIVCQLILEHGGKRAMLLWMVFSWIAPIFTAVIMGVSSSDKLLNPAIYVSAFSGFPLVFYGAQEAFTVEQPPVESAVIAKAFRLGLAFQMIMIIVMGVRVYLQKRKFKQNSLQS